MLTVALGVPLRYQEQAAEQDFVQNECFSYVRSLALAVELCEDTLEGFSRGARSGPAALSLLDFGAWLADLREKLKDQAEMLADAEEAHLAVFDGWVCEN